MKMKRIVSLMLAMVMCFALELSALAAPLASAMALGDGNVYFYFWASDLKVESPKNYKVGYSVNGSDPIYFTSNFPAKTERIDKALLNPGEVNTFTIFTGDTTAMIDESLSRNEAGTGCDEFSIITTALNLSLPDGVVVSRPTVYSYAPKDAQTPLRDGYIKTQNTDSRIYLGDNSLTSYWKIDIEFDLTGISWDSSVEADLPVIKNLSLQIGATPEQRNLVWYSTSKEASVAQLALKSDMTSESFPENPQSFSATSEETGLTGYQSCKTTITGLLPNTEYVYRVGNEADGWSEIYSFQTTAFDEKNFSFVAVADPQLGQGRFINPIEKEIEAWENTLHKMNGNFPNAAFLACMGDQISESCIESEYDAFFYPQLLKSYALAVVPGNHDYGANYTPHYNMPNVSALGKHNSMGDGSGDYYFTYGDVLFMVINAKCNDNNEHIRFMEETIGKHPDVKWKFLMMHEGLYGATDQGFRTDYIIQLREDLTAPISRLGIDVVLDGHEHTYSRSYMINAAGEPNLATGGESVTDPVAGETVYITLGTATGTDYCVPLDQSELPCVAKIVKEDIPKFTTVDITDSSVTIDTYRVSDMAKVDTFSIRKSLSVSPKNVSVKAGETQTFSAEVYGEESSANAVTWSVSGNESDKTAISEDGVLSVASDEMAQILTVTATLVADPGKSASAIVSVDNNITDVNVGEGVTYQLPKSIDNSSVTWKDSAGNTVQYADTSKVGYRFYTGTLSDDTEVIYRVNVGEYKTLMEDDFEGYSEAQYRSAVTKNITGGYFSKQAYAQETDPQQLMKDGENTVAAFGPNVSNLNNFKWTPSDKAKGEAFKLSYQLRVSSLDLSTVKKGNNFGYLFSNNFDNAAGVQLRVVAENNQITKTELKCNSTSELYADITKLVKWSSPDSNNVVSMQDYVTVEIDGNNVQYSVRVDGTEVANSVVWSAPQYISNGVQSINMAKRSWGDEVAVTYLDEMTFSKAVYVADRIRNTPAEATVGCGDGSLQTTQVSLPMSDGAMKSFIVNYTADTATEGVKTAVGYIDGFDDTVTVTYTVVDPSVLQGMVISPRNVSVKAGGTQEFSAQVYADDIISNEVSWSVSGNESTKTTINGDGVLSVAANEMAQTLTVTATLVEDPEKFASATVNVETDIRVVNVGSGVTYQLPKTVDNSSVTWEDSLGNPVQYADTSKVGYRFYTGILADSTAVMYRVNVGEYKALIEDDFEGYSEADYQAKTVKYFDNGYLNKQAYTQSTDEQQLTKDGNNTVAAFGPNISQADSFKWVLTPDKAKGEAFRLSYQLRVSSLDLSTVKKGSSFGYLFSNNFEHATGVQLRVIVENGKITQTQLRCNGVSEVFADISDFVKWTTPGNDNLVSMEDYITVVIEGNNVQYAAKVNGTEVANSVAWSAPQYIANGVQSINMAKRSWGDEVAVTYLDDMAFSKGVYVTGRIREISVTETLSRGDAALQTAQVSLPMSDGTTKSFTVNYTADTTTEGVKTAVGKIDGFDDSLTVTYTVVQPTVITAIENDSDGITQVKLQNNMVLDAGTQVYVAVYDKTSGALQDVYTTILTESQWNQGNQTVSLSEDALSGVSNALVKAFIWSRELRPLALPLETAK